MSFKKMRTALRVLGVGMFCAAALALNGAQAGVHDWVYEEGRRVNGVAHTMKLRVAPPVSAGNRAGRGDRAARVGGRRGGPQSRVPDRRFGQAPDREPTYRVDVLQKEGARTVRRTQVRAPESWPQTMSLKIAEAIVDAPMAGPHARSTKTNHCQRWVKLSDEFGVRVFCDDALAENKYLIHLSASVSGVVSGVRKKY